jgi:hypothetical protein
MNSSYAATESANSANASLNAADRAEQILGTINRTSSHLQQLNRDALARNERQNQQTQGNGNQTLIDALAAAINKNSGSNNTYSGNMDSEFAKDAISGMKHHRLEQKNVVDIVYVIKYLRKGETMAQGLDYRAVKAVQLYTTCEKIINTAANVIANHAEHTNKNQPVSYATWQGLCENILNQLFPGGSAVAKLGDKIERLPTRKHGEELREYSDTMHEFSDNVNWYCKVTNQCKNQLHHRIVRKFVGGVNCIWAQIATSDLAEDHTVDLQNIFDKINAGMAYRSLDQEVDDTHKRQRPSNHERLHTMDTQNEKKDTETLNAIQKLGGSIEKLLTAQDEQSKKRKVESTNASYDNKLAQTMQTSLQAMTDSNDRTARSIQKMADNDNNHRARELDSPRRDNDRTNDRPRRHETPRDETPRRTDRYEKREPRGDRYKPNDNKYNNDRNRDHNDKRREQQPRDTPRGTTSSTQCHDHMLHVCKRTNCKYSHEGRKVCRFFTRNGGTCTKEGCPMPHVLIECPQHMKGACHRGTECRFSHNPLATKNV